MTQSTKLRRARGAYTLMELLVVITIMVMLAAIALPVAKQVMNDSHIREASRTLNAYITMAKSRAAQTGRPCGIEFVCQAPLGDVSHATLVGGPAYISAVTQFYLAEIPPPYCGDIIGALANAPTFTTASAGQLTIDTLAASASLPSLIRNGDRFEIRFNYKGPWFVGYRDTSTGNFMIYGPGGEDGAFGRKGVDDDNNGTADDATEYRWPGSDDLLVMPPTQPSFYQIRRAPHRIGNALEMPSGSCVDMECSGMGQSGAQFGNLSLAAQAISITPVPATPLQLQSVLVLFSPQGPVESFYIRVGTAVGTASASFITQGPLEPTGTLHFLVGKIEKENALNGPANDSIRNPSTYLMFDPVESNLADPNSLWVSIGRIDGGVTTTENDPPPTNLPTSGPKTVTIFPNEQPSPNGRNLVLNPNQQFATAFSTYLGYCRTIATNREQMRGR